MSIFTLFPIKFTNVIIHGPRAAHSNSISVGEPKEELEKIKDYKAAIFWAFSRKDYQKTNWWSKTASTNIITKLTIRTANTIKRIVNM